MDLIGEKCKIYEITTRYLPKYVVCTVVCMPLMLVNEKMGFDKKDIMASSLSIDELVIRA